MRAQPQDKRLRQSPAGLEYEPAAAEAGRALLAASPDGSLLRAGPAVLAGTALTDWRLPGLLLALLVGG
ncbi:hypothetical protein EAS64_25805 [Trebonia kvetii]|uniref:Uncharacterized protein n=1 Tax=Trebonia kvetii TaxID=2480626 RepID=A0A6P2BTD9_9ACTN|nr:hypothetical protein [Trebonia kvetii]TVZ02240.1 hypothetical protein EAS64_25805 [Trebonia kvetii]